MPPHGKRLDEDDVPTVTDTPDAVEIKVSAIVGSATREPFVHFSLGEHVQLFPTAKAREVAFMLLEAAESAESDAFLFEFVTDKIGRGDPAAGAAVLMEYRKWKRKNTEGVTDHPI